ncbi:hypothetical protein D3C72_1276650 [compost metagenome]
MHNGQVLARLRHHAVIGGDHEQREVDAACARGHGVNQLLMARDIDQAEHVAVLERHVRIAKLDREAARLPFLQSVGIHARQRPDQAGLAMIDMSCRADDHGCVR